MRLILYIFCFLSLLSCSLAPTYHRPPLAFPNHYRETGKWQTANPTYAVTDRGPWWKIYNDPILNTLEMRVTRANQNLQAAYERYKEACALVAVARSYLFPTVTANAGITRLANSSNTALSVPSTYDDFTIGPTISYEIDVWGRVRNNVIAALDQAKASATDWTAIDLMLHAELASDYFNLRATDQSQQILEEAVKAYRLAYNLVSRRHAGGVSPIADVDQAKSQLDSAITLAQDNRLKRAKLEHAIAVLVGVVPAEFHLSASTAPMKIVTIAPVIPCGLLQRRPDVAGAELRVQAANAKIGVARAAYFPDFNILGGIGFESADGYNLFSLPSLFYSLGPSAALTLIDGGRIDAFVRYAKAAYFETVANYRQTSLTAFQEVEDNLVAIHRLNQELVSQAGAVRAAYAAEKQAEYRYKGGVINYLDVVYEQNIALQAALIDTDIKARRQLASVNLIKALGGGWGPV